MVFSNLAGDHTAGAAVFQTNFGRSLPGVSVRAWISFANFRQRELSPKSRLSLE
jgi:hypothetical protein